MDEKDFRGKRVVLTGATGGLGMPLCDRLARLGCSLILPVRNLQKGEYLQQKLLQKYPDITVELLPFDAADFESVKAACDRLEQLPFTVFFWCAGAYKIPRQKCSTGLDSIFQINFATPYYMICRLLPALERRGGCRVVAVGSIAHRYGKAHGDDPDASTQKGCAKPYGNAKRWLMAALFERFLTSPVPLCVVHPGIAVTEMTAHFPKNIYWLLKPIMKLLFMSPKAAVKNLVAGMTADCGSYEWVGPRFFDVWGGPCKRRLGGFSAAEKDLIRRRSAELFAALSSVGKTVPPSTVSGVTVYHFDSLPSTNSAAAAWVKSGGPCDTVLWADTQTAGRGRGDHSFYSPAGGIYCSLILPQSKDFTPASLTITAAVAMCRTLTRFCECDPKIKWVNDIYLENRKVCGILAEGASGGRAPAAVLGIGVNLIAPQNGFPPGLAGIAGAVLPFGTDRDRLRFLALFLEEWRRLQLTPHEKILAEYRRRNYLENRCVTYTQNGVSHRAAVAGIDDDGRLVVSEDGKETALCSGEVSVLPQESENS